jgi:hypothetical protein
MILNTVSERTHFDYHRSVAIHIPGQVTKPFGIAFGGAVLVIVILVWVGFANTKGNHLVPTGNIGKVRVQPLDDTMAMVVLDFNLNDNSDRPMVVRSIEASVELPNGQTVTGTPFAAADVQNVFRNYPLLGEQYNPPLKARDEVPPHGRIDRMVGISVKAPPSEVEKWKHIILRVEDVTGPVAEIRK